MLSAKLLPLCPASAQSAQADFVSPAPDFIPGNETFDLSVTKAAPITQRASIPASHQKLDNLP
jgi:hypothetical protein